MSARKLEPSSGDFSEVNVQERKSSLTLSAGVVSISKNGIEFRSPTAIATWTEMTVDLQASHSVRKLHCTGVVVDCSGSKHLGYHVSMVFTGLSKQAEARLSLMAHSALS